MALLPTYMHEEPLNYIIYLSSKEVRAKKTIHLPPKEEGVFLEILDKLQRKTHTLACRMKVAFSMKNYISTT